MEKDGKTNKYIGVITEDRRFYKFTVLKRIDANGKVEKIGPDDFLRTVMKIHSDWDYSRLFRNYANQITFRANINRDNRALLNLAGRASLELEINLENDIELNRAGTGFITRENYTGASAIGCIGSGYEISKRTRADIIGRDLKKVLSNAREDLDAFFREKKSDAARGDLSRSDLARIFRQLDPGYTLQNERMDYSTAHIADYYGKANETQYYLLKYGFAYSYLYYRIYEDIFREIEQREEASLHAFSIGCGSKIDLVGLRLALSSRMECEKPVYYYGIDAVDWSEGRYCFYPEDGCFECTDIQHFLAENEEISANVILFAYSMAELKKEEYRDANGLLPWDYVCGVFDAENNLSVEGLPQKLTEKAVYLATPIRHKDNLKRDDRKTFGQLTKAMERAGYFLCSTTDGEGRHEVLKTIDDVSEEIYQTCGYDKARGSIGKLLEEIRKYGEDSGEVIKSTPIMRDFIVSYRIVCFERR